MFTCTRCGKEKPESEERAVGGFARFGMRLVSSPPNAVATRRFCRRCARITSMGGMIAASAIVAVTLVLSFGLCNGVADAVTHQSGARQIIIASLAGLGVMWLIFFRKTESWWKLVLVMPCAVSATSLALMDFARNLPPTVSVPNAGPVNALSWQYSPFIAIYATVVGIVFLRRKDPGWTALMFLLVGLMMPQAVLMGWMWLCWIFFPNSISIGT